MNRITKGRFGKAVAAVLLVAMVFSGVPAPGVSAQENDETVATVQGEQQDTVDNQQETENTEAPQEGTEEETQEPVQDVPEEETESTDSIQQPEEATEPQNEENNEQAGKLNYLYLGSDYIEAPGTQNIMVSWGTGEENVSAMRLVYVNAQNEETVLDAEKQEDNTWLFSKEFSESETGVYTLLRLETEADGMVENYIFEDAGMNILFGVNEGVNEEEVSEHIDMESFETEEEQETNVETSVVALSEEGEEAVESIASALGEAEQQTENSASASLRSRAATFSTRSSDLVIVLDPGHDSSHTGASGNGVREEVATLKIAQYCKEELEQYAGVTVYMTREGAACPYPETIGVSSGNILDIKKRVQWAASQGADAFISIHLNSSTSSSANGAQVFYPEASFAGNSVANEGAALANKIQQELLALGLNRRANDDADYAVNTESAKYGFPGLIIEHAFVSNASDANNYLNSDDKLKRLGVADATGIANYYGLSKEKTVEFESGTYNVSTLLDANMNISAEGTENGSSITIEGAADTSSQRLEIVERGDGLYSISFENSGKVLDVKDASAEPGTFVQLYTWNGTNAQLWKFIDAGDGYVYIKSALGTYLDVKDGHTSSGTLLNCFTLNESRAQKWKLKIDDYHFVSDGTYEIQSSINTTSVLDVALGSKDNGGNIQIYNSNSTSAQRYEVLYQGNGYYKIQAEHSGKVLDIKGGSKTAGANLQQYDWNNGDGQLWKFIKADDNSVYIKSKSGLVIDLTNGATVSGTNIQAYTDCRVPAQRWILKKTEYRPIDDGTYVIQSSIKNSAVLTEKDGNIQIGNFDYMASQRFDVTYISNGYYKIASEDTGKVLDVTGWSTANGTNLQSYEWNDSVLAAQLWKFVSTGDGSYIIKSKLGTVVDLRNGSVLDGTNVQMYQQVNGVAAQKWILNQSLVSLKKMDIEDGTYEIQSSISPDKVLDIANGSINNNGNVQIYQSSDASSPRFEISSQGNGYYKITVEKSGKVLDVENNSSASKANLQQYDWKGIDGQLWSFIDAGDGTVYIRSKLGTVIDLTNGNTANGTNVQMYACAYVPAQRWVLEKTEYRPIDDGTYVIQSSIKNSAVLTEKDGNIQIGNFDYMASQRFDVTYISNGYYKIASEDTGKVLDVTGWSTANGTNLQSYEWNDSVLAAQLWKFVSTGDGSYIIKSKLGTVVDLRNGSVLDGTNVQMYQQVNGVAAQKWILNQSLVSLKKMDIEDGTYEIQSSISPDKVLDIANGSINNNGNVQIYQSSDASSPRFEISSQGNGYYKITVEKSGKVLDVENNSSASKANLQQYDWKGIDGQLWSFIDAGDGTVYIRSKLGTVIDLTNGNTANGTNVQMYACAYVPAQRWILSDKTELYEIMGASSITLGQMVRYYEAHNSSYPYASSDASTITEFCQMYLDECETEGVKAEVAFAQAMNETGFLKFGGDVKPEQYNFAGLGATGGVPGESFPSVRIGIRAHVQHLKAYASTEPLVNECVDNRFRYVTRGSAPYVEWLGIHENPNGSGWASALNYGYTLVNKYIFELKSY